MSMGFDGPEQPSMPSLQAVPLLAGLGEIPRCATHLYGIHHPVQRPHLPGCGIVHRLGTGATLLLHRCQAGPKFNLAREGSDAARSVRGLHAQGR